MRGNNEPHFSTAPYVDGAPIAPRRISRQLLVNNIKGIQVGLLISRRDEAGVLLRNTNHCYERYAVHGTIVHDDAEIEKLDDLREDGRVILPPNGAVRTLFGYRDCSVLEYINDKNYEEVCQVLIALERYIKQSQ